MNTGKKSPRPAKSRHPRHQEKRALLASQVKNMVDRIATMEETGEPFGTVTIAEMGQKLASQGKDVIFCAESVISTRVPDVVLDETGRTFREVAIQQEAPFLGIPELRQAIAQRFSRLYGYDVNWQNQIIVTSGSMQSEYFLMSALINPGDEVIVPTPTFFFDIPVLLARGKPVYSKAQREERVSPRFKAAGKVRNKEDQDNYGLQSPESYRQSPD